jgi:hypothetical protein
MAERLYLWALKWAIRTCVRQVHYHERRKARYTRLLQRTQTLLWHTQSRVGRADATEDR